MPNSEDNYISYIDRCKKVGRLGPKEVRIDTKSAFGDVIFAGRDGLDVEAVGSFASVRANTAVFSGRYYYEVLLKTDGLM
jgi:Kip1 ubiquitination-promoting complex protein 1